MLVLPITSLVLKRKILLHSEKEGAFGIPSATTPIDSYTTYTSPITLLIIWLWGEEVVLKKIITYYLLINNNDGAPATKTGFMQVRLHKKS